MFILKLAFLFLILGSLVVAVGVFTATNLPLRNNPGLVQGMQIIKNDPAVADLFGTPIRLDLRVTGRLQGHRYGDSVGNLMTSVSGPMNKGEAVFYLTRTQGGSWHLQRMSIYVDKKLVLDWDSGSATAGFQTHVSPP